ncbi:hypothetical protein [Hymenobacter sp. B81]|uniref:hypothetical protein n=1 Tax=Hymenobacter sp. B81 TaxID=3344878 RepID=UPI0037DC5581
MMIRFLLPALGLLLAVPALAQTDDESAARPLGLGAARWSYSLNAGATFAGRYGSASYLSPQATYQLSNRLQLFGGLTYLRAMPGAAFYPAPENGAPAAGRLGSNHYLLQGGGTYALSPRLALTGSAWKDFSPRPAPGTRVNPYAGFGNLGSGVNLRADYQITERFSVSGGLRFSQGAAPTQLPLGIGPAGF